LFCSAPDWPEYRAISVLLVVPPLLIVVPSKVYESSWVDNEPRAVSPVATVHTLVLLKGALTIDVPCAKGAASASASTAPKLTIPVLMGFFFSPQKETSLNNQYSERASEGCTRHNVYQYGVIGQDSQIGEGTFILLE
jgi:hypothetical protein